MCELASSAQSYQCGYTAASGWPSAPGVGSSLLSGLSQPKYIGSLKASTPLELIQAELYASPYSLIGNGGFFCQVVSSPCQSSTAVPGMNVVAPEVHL